MKLPLSTLFIAVCALSAFAQIPKIEPGVSKDLAAWRAAHYSDVRYKLDLSLEKMSPVLKGTIEIRVNVSPGAQASPPATSPGGVITPIILDWRKLPGHERDSTITNVTLNGRTGIAIPRNGVPGKLEESQSIYYREWDEHLIFRDGVIAGENVIKLDFTSPILTSGSAITRSVDQKTGSEYVFSHFSPMVASTAFPLFDQQDLKAKISLAVIAPDSLRSDSWKVVSSSVPTKVHQTEKYEEIEKTATSVTVEKSWVKIWTFAETKPISIYEFYFKAGPKK